MDSITSNLRRAALALTLLAATAAIGQTRELKNAYRQPLMQTKDIPYREAAFYDSPAANVARCKLDLTLPKDTRGFATIVWFHGGGLTGGAKHTPLELTLDREHPIAVAACGYRLAKTDGATGQTCIDDAAAAVAWVLKHIADYGGDPTKVFVSGHSAGAYLTCMVGMDARWLQRYGCHYRQLRGLIPISGQCVTHFTIRAEKGIPMAQPTCDDLAPLYHVGAPDLPPILLTTGDPELEMCGRQEENAYFCRMLRLNGHRDVKHLTFQGYGHNCTLPSFPMAVEFVRRLAWK